MQALGQSGNTFAHLLVDETFQHPPHEIGRIAVMQPQLGSVSAFLDMEIGGSIRNRKFAGLEDVDFQALVRLVMVDTFFNAPKRSQLAESRRALGHRSVGGQTGFFHAWIPSLDIAKVVEYVPDNAQRRFNGPRDREFRHESRPSSCSRIKTPGVVAVFRLPLDNEAAQGRMKAMVDLHFDADDPELPECQSLIDAHLTFARTHTPPGHVHALGSEALGTDDVSFFTARRQGVPVAMAALRDLGERHAEIKSIHTASEHRGQGVAKFMLERVMGVARERGMKRLSLETGTQPAFEPARALFQSLGFEVCEPFADYTDNPNSVCMTRLLPEA